MPAIAEVNMLMVDLSNDEWKTKINNHLMWADLLFSH